MKALRQLRIWNIQHGFAVSYVIWMVIAYIAWRFL